MMNKVLFFRKRKEHKVLIAGTGRAGTTFLVRFLTEIGLDTGFHSDKISNGHGLIKKCNAGLEKYGKLVIEGKTSQPYIVKSPFFWKEIPTINKKYKIDMVFIPKRDIIDVAKSRLKNGKNNPGGYNCEGDDLESIKESLMYQEERLMTDIKRLKIPYVYLEFPNLVEDSRYLYGKLQSIIGNMSYEKFSEAFSTISAVTKSDFYSKEEEKDNLTKTCSE